MPHCSCERGKTCNHELLKLYKENLRLRKRASKEQLRKAGPLCVPCCQTGYFQHCDVAGCAEEFHPYALINRLGPDKPGDRRRLCCCLRRQNRILRGARCKPQFLLLGNWFLNNDISKAAPGLLVGDPDAVEDASELRSLPSFPFGQGPSWSLCCDGRGVLYASAPLQNDSATVYKSNDGALTWGEYLRIPNQDYPSMVICCGKDVYVVTAGRSGVGEIFLNGKKTLEGSFIFVLLLGLYTCCKGDLYLVDSSKQGTINAKTGELIDQPVDGIVPLFCIDGVIYGAQLTVTPLTGILDKAIYRVQNGGWILTGDDLPSDINFSDRSLPPGARVSQDCGGYSYIAINNELYCTSDGKTFSEVFAAQEPSPPAVAEVWPVGCCGDRVIFSSLDITPNGTELKNSKTYSLKNGTFFPEELVTPYSSPAPNFFPFVPFAASCCCTPLPPPCPSNLLSPTPGAYVSEPAPGDYEFVFVLAPEEGCYVCILEITGSLTTWTNGRVLSGRRISVGDETWTFTSDTLKDGTGEKDLLALSNKTETTLTVISGSTGQGFDTDVVSGVMTVTSTTSGEVYSGNAFDMPGLAGDAFFLAVPYGAFSAIPGPAGVITSTDSGDPNIFSVCGTADIVGTPI